MRTLKNVYFATALIVMGLVGLAVGLILLLAAWGILATFIGVPAAIVMPIVVFIIYMAYRFKK